LFGGLKQLDKACQRTILRQSRYYPLARVLHFLAKKVALKRIMAFYDGLKVIFFRVGTSITPADLHPAEQN
jgi:hypothetical protein